MLRGCAFFVVAVAAAGCSDAAPTRTTGSVDALVVLAPGETAGIADGGVRVRFQGVISDARCPADALCIQVGDAIVRVEVTSSSGAAAYELHTGNVRPVRHADLMIALVQLSPYPFSSRPIQPTEYRATLRITR